MLLIRPVNFADLQHIEQLAVISGGSLTTLPANRDHLSDLISRTQRSLQEDIQQHADESYHFALVDSETNALVGIAGIDAAVGLSSPFYSYRIEEVVHASGELQIHNRIPALHLCQDYNGAARFCTLFLAEEHRSLQNLNLLSRARMLFMAQHPNRFAQRVVAELQGVADEDNQSPFWECLGKHFFNMDFTKANYLTGINSKGFIADLMPHYPVYVPLLSEAAQASLGQCRPDMEAAYSLLTHENFTYRGYIDIFDAGPTLECRTDEIHTLSKSQLTSVGITDNPIEGELHLISNLKLKEFRCIIAPINTSQPELNAQQAEALGIDSSSQVRIVPLNTQGGASL